MRPGEKNMVTGLGVAALGAVVTAATYEMASGGGVYVVAYGAIIGGAIQFIIGLVQFIGSATMTPERRDRESAKLLVQTILQCMVYVAHSDGELHADEMAAIKNVVRTVFGFEVEDKILHKIASQEETFVGSDYLAERRYLLDVATKDLIAKACLLVAAAEGGVSESEQQRIGSVLSAIGAEPGTLERAVAAFHGAVPGAAQPATA